jgi:nucleoside-diphosphate-sugar epimerase
MKILITGASGYVGSNLVRSLNDTNHKVYLVLREIKLNIDVFNSKLDCHIYNGIENLIDYFKEVEPELVIHAAGYIVNNYDIKDLKYLIDSNIYFGLEILEAMRASGCKKIINIGSLYQTKKVNLYQNYNLYAATKNAFEEIVDYYVIAYGISVLKMRFSNIYGLENKRSILNKLIMHVGDPSEFKFYSSDKLLNFINIDKVINSIISNLNSFMKSESRYHKPIIIKSRNSIMLSELINLIELISNNTLNHNLKSSLYSKRKIRFHIAPRKHTALKEDIFKLLNYDE